MYSHHARADLKFHSGPRPPCFGSLGGAAAKKRYELTAPRPAFCIPCGGKVTLHYCCKASLPNTLAVGPQLVNKMPGFLPRCSNAPLLPGFGVFLWPLFQHPKMNPRRTITCWTGWPMNPQGAWTGLSRAARCPNTVWRKAEQDSVAPEALRRLRQLRRLRRLRRLKRMGRLRR